MLLLVNLLIRETLTVEGCFSFGMKSVKVRHEISWEFVVRRALVALFPFFEVKILSYSLKCPLTFRNFPIFSQSFVVLTLV